MSTTSEIVERLREGVPFEPRGTFSGKLMFEAAARLSELERSVEGLRAMHKLIASNLGEYIDREGSVDVTIAIAFETARAALAGSGEK
jgi:hypothetical protein